MTIYQLTEEYLNLIEALEDPEFEKDIISEMLQDAGDDLDKKIEDYGKVIKQLKADAESIKAESKRLADRAKTIENNSKHLMDTLQSVMVATGKTKIKTELFTFGIQKNPASVVMDESNIDNIPLEFLVIQPATVNKSLIKEKLQAGEVLEFAHLEQGESLRIR